MSSLIQMQAYVDWVEGPIEKSKKKLAALVESGKDVPTAQLHRYKAHQAGQASNGTRYNSSGSYHKAKYEELAGEAARAKQGIKAGPPGNFAESGWSKPARVGGGGPTKVKAAAPGAPGNPKPGFRLRRKIKQGKASREAARMRSGGDGPTGRVNPAARNEQARQGITQRMAHNPNMSRNFHTQMDGSSHVSTAGSYNLGVKTGKGRSLTGQDKFYGR